MKTQTLILFPALLGVGMALAEETGNWPLDEGSGTTTADTSGLGNNGTLIVPGTSWVDLGGGDYAIGFDGINGRVNIPNSTGHVEDKPWGDYTTQPDWNGEYWCWDADTLFIVTWELKVRPGPAQAPRAPGFRPSADSTARGSWTATWAEAPTSPP